MQTKILSFKTFIILAFGVAIGLSFSFFHDRYLESNGRDFAEESISSILQPINQDALNERLSKGSHDTKAIKKAFKQITRRLGELQSFKLVEVDASVVYHKDLGLIRVAKVVADATFKKGSGQIYMLLRLSDSKWTIQEMLIHSKKLPNGEIIFIS